VQPYPDTDSVPSTSSSTRLDDHDLRERGLRCLWQSDSVAATINSNGTLMGQRPGTATITATYQSATARRAVQIINNFVGTWIGNGRITGCDAVGDFAASKFCDMFSLNTIRPITLTLSQNRDAVSGSLVLGSINGLVTGSVDSVGEYIANATGTGAREDVVLTYVSGGFVGQASASESIVWWAMNVVAPGWRGNAYVKVNSDILRRSGPLSIVPYTVLAGGR